MHGAEARRSHKVLSYGQHFGILAVPLAKAGWDRCFNTSLHRVPIDLNENHVAGVKPWGHSGARHMKSHNECFLLLSPDGQQNLVAYLAHPTLVIDMDALKRSMVRGVTQGTIVHYMQPSHFLDCTEALRGAEAALVKCSADMGKRAPESRKGSHGISRCQTMLAPRESPRHEPRWPGPCSVPPTYRIHT